MERGSMYLPRSQTSLVDNEELFHEILNDPESCRRLFLTTKSRGIRNEYCHTFFGYLKKLIMSREVYHQQKVVKCLISVLTDTELNKMLGQEEEYLIVAKMLDNDFAEFLCEALPFPSTTCDTYLLQGIFHCLALLSSSNEFYQFHAVYALESVLRSLHFVCQYLLKSDNATSENEHPTLSSGLSVVAIILHGSVNKINLVRNCNQGVAGGSMLKRLSELIITTLNFKNPCTKWRSGLVVRSLLHSWHLGSIFHFDDVHLMESVCDQKVCISRNVVAQDNTNRSVNEVQRKMCLFHRKVQFIHTKSTTMSSILSINSSKCCDENMEMPNSLPFKEIKLLIRIIEETVKELENYATCILEPKISSNNTMKNQFMLLMFQIGKNVLQLLPHKNNASIKKRSSKGSSNDIQENYFKNDPFREIFNILSKPIGGSCAIFLVEMEFETSNLCTYKEYFICLELLYEKFGQFCAEISHRLAAEGYLTMLPLLLTSQYYREDEIMKTSCQIVLAHLLSTLSEVELNWSNSFFILNQGLSKLPLNMSLWPSVLSEKSYEPSGTAVLIFSYFYCISSSRPELAIPFLMPLVSFIKCVFIGSKDAQDEEVVPAPILKALWFTFAISYLSNGCPVNPHVDEASQQLINLICDYQARQKSREIRSIFTYHPALLLWAFSSPVTNSSIQLHVMLSWLQGCESSKPCQEIEKLLLLNQDAFLCLLDIAEVSNTKIMECALRTLWSGLQTVELNEQRKMSSNLWEILLHILKRYCALRDNVIRERRAVNISCILQLSRAFNQSEPSSSTVIRLACLLNNILADDSSNSMYKTKNHFILYLSGLRMLHYLLNISFEKEDTRVASSMLRHHGQLRRLEWAASLCTEIVSSSGSREGMVISKQKRTPKHFFEELNSAAYLIISELLLIHPFNSEDSSQSISLNSWHLLNAISNNNQELCYSTMKLFSALAQVHIIKPTLVSRPFVKIVEKNSEVDCFSSSSFIRTLYLHFMMLCTTMPLNTESLCWEFLSLALRLQNKTLTTHLAKLPWNHTLINAKLPSDEVKSCNQKFSGSSANLFSISFLHFLNQWLEHQRQDKEYSRYTLRTKRNEFRNIGSLMFQKTISKIAKALVSENCSVGGLSQSSSNKNEESAIKNTILLVLLFEKQIPDVINLEMKRKLSTLSA